jgi:hypothetical protein
MEIALPVQSAVAAPQWTLHPAPPFLWWLSWHQFKSVVMPCGWQIKTVVLGRGKWCTHRGP